MGKGGVPHAQAQGQGGPVHLYLYILFPRKVMNNTVYIMEMLNHSLTKMTFSIVWFPSGYDKIE